ncbi:MAG: DUF6498-containing protein [Patescibacteria group bacterium]
MKNYAIVHYMSIAKKIVISYHQEPERTRALFLANIIPIIGVMLLNWSVVSLLYSYWVESVFFLVANLYKTARSKGPLPEKYLSYKKIPGKNLSFIQKMENSKESVLLEQIFLAVIAISGFFGIIAFFFSISEMISGNTIYLPTFFKLSGFDLVGLIIMVVSFTIYQIRDIQIYLRNHSYIEISAYEQAHISWTRIFVMFGIMMSSTFYIFVVIYSKTLGGLLIILVKIGFELYYVLGYGRNISSKKYIFWQ